MISSREKSIWICPSILLLMNLMRFLSIQGLLTGTHKWSMCTSSCIIRWIHYWNLITLRTLWIALQGMLISWTISRGGQRMSFAMFFMTNSLSKDLDIFSLIDWKSLLSSLFSMKVAFKAIICICDQKSFNNLVITLQEEDFMDDISMEYKFY
jgi:hypothetical protein